MTIDFVDAELQIVSLIRSSIRPSYTRTPQVWYVCVFDSSTIPDEIVSSIDSRESFTITMEMIIFYGCCSDVNGKMYTGINHAVCGTIVISACDTFMRKYFFFFFFKSNTHATTDECVYVYTNRHTDTRPYNKKNCNCVHVWYV